MKKSREKRNLIALPKNSIDFDFLNKQQCVKIQKNEKRNSFYHIICSEY